MNFTFTPINKHCCFLGGGVAWSDRPRPYQRPRPARCLLSLSLAVGPRRSPPCSATAPSCSSARRHGMYPPGAASNHGLSCCFCPGSELREPEKPLSSVPPVTPVLSLLQLQPLLLRSRTDWQRLNCLSCSRGWKQWWRGSAAHWEGSSRLS